MVIIVSKLTKLARFSSFFSKIHRKDIETQVLVCDRAEPYSRSCSNFWPFGALIMESDDIYLDYFAQIDKSFSVLECL